MGLTDNPTNSGTLNIISSTDIDISKLSLEILSETSTIYTEGKVYTIMNLSGGGNIIGTFKSMSAGKTINPLVCIVNIVYNPQDIQLTLKKTIFNSALVAKYPNIPSVLLRTKVIPDQSF